MPDDAQSESSEITSSPSSLPRVLCGTLFVAFFAFALWKFIPDDEQAIRRRLQALEDLLNLPEQLPLLQIAGRMGDMRDILTEDVTVHLEVPTQSLKGREPTVKYYGGMMRLYKGLRVRFSSPKIELTAPNNATVTLQVQATRASGTSRGRERPFTLHWVRLSGAWYLKAAREQEYDDVD